ncbi:MAG: hypothetical protein GX600_10745, partial [Dehalococcoidia bacterium]|nr:hypothetical protein [Dehalococcoidia bacterium]
MRTIPRSTRSVLTAYAFAVVTVALADDQWFPFTPRGGSLEPGVIGMADWLEKPAGARGGVRMRGDEFIFEDGTPVKFWGANLQFTDCMPDKGLGERMARRFAKYGLNAIRLHKIMEPDWAGFGDRNDSTRFDAAKLDRFDHFTAALKSNGIYYGISWVFHHSIRPGDRDKVIAYDEIKAQKGETSRVLVFIAEDVQNLRIQMLVNLLMHTNPYTRVTYAHDPAVNFVEFQNEDSIFFYTFNGFDDLKTLPTYKKLFIKRYSEWLRRKYGSHEALVKAWSTNAMNAFAVKDEHLDRNNIMPTGNPWMFSPEGLAQGTSRGIRARLLDNAQFLYEVQKEFYDRFTKAVRATGYKGPLVGSCWTTPAGLPSYYNLLTDYQVGVIDRHNYFGGQDGYSPHTGPFKNITHLDKPGSGLLSFGLHQAVDRPFQLSEWNTVFPDQWALESPTLVAAYGIGLQGWDASYQFTASARDTMWDIVA